MMKYEFNVVKTKRIKVILDTDTKNEADDQFAIVHALLTPMFDIRGIIASHFGHDRIEDSLQASWEELKKILLFSGFKDKVPAVKGAPTWLKKKHGVGYFDELIPMRSEGSDLIIEEAAKLNPGEKLYIGVLGPLSNIATALILAPEIADRIIIIWNGGGQYPYGGPEFNLVNDINAANYVMSSKAELWQIPIKTYAIPRVSLAEMQIKVRPYGKIGKYLFEQTLDFFELMKDNSGWPLPESLDICDETIIGLLMEPHKYCYDYIQAPYITYDMYYKKIEGNRPIRVYKELDGRYILEDFFCKLIINYGEKIYAND